MEWVLEYDHGPERGNRNLRWIRSLYYSQAKDDTLEGCVVLWSRVMRNANGLPEKYRIRNVVTDEQIPCAGLV